MGNVHELMQNMMQEKMEKDQNEEFVAAIESVKKPLAFRVDEMTHFIVDKICKEFHSKKSDFCRSLFESALHDAVEEIGYEFSDIQEDFIKTKKSQIKNQEEK